MYIQSKLFATIACATLLGFASLAATKPNFVVIFIDDMGYADIGPFGATKQKTPNLDKMAKDSVKMTSFYAAPVCSVSRAQMMTGCYGARISVPGVFFPAGPQGLNPKEFTMAERLKEQGYSTACIGKWHLGDQPQFMPTRQGFDFYYGIPYSNDMQREAKDDDVRVVPLMRNEKVDRLLKDDDQDQIVELYVKEATTFIRDNKDKPFLLYFPQTAVHTPIHPGKKFQGKSQNGRFGDWVEEVDWSVGQVMNTLKELGLDEKTVVVFTSDNGPWLVKKSDGGCALPLRGGKGGTFEGGVRVPTLVRWTGSIAPGTVCDTVAGTIDLLPTFVSLAGGKVPAEPVIDGRDISNVLLGKTQEAQRDAHYYFASYNLQAVRQGPWKLAVKAQNESMGATKQEMKNPRLYNLDTDISETTDVSEKHPEIVAKLAALIAKKDAEIGGDNPTARRAPGIAENPITLYPTLPKSEKKQEKKASKKQKN
jgi:arylsulfatase A